MNEFSKALLRSAKADAPAAHAKARALAHVQTALSAAPAVAAAGAVKSIGLSKLALVAGASFVVAGAAGTAGGYQLGRTSIPRPPPAAAPIAPEPAPRAVPPAVPTPAPAAATVPPALVDLCSDVAAPESNRCSAAGGNTVTFALTSQCAQERLDVFWVDLSCREVFKGILEPGDIFWQDSWDTHVFRVRSHATHRLVKEFAALPVAGAPDRHAEWSGPRSQLPLVTLAPEDRPLGESAPAECSHGGGRAAALHVRNERTESVVLMWVDSTCKEQYVAEVKPDSSLDKDTSEGHAYRIRDLSGALLTEIPPTSPDTATYLTVP